MAEGTTGAAARNAAKRPARASSPRAAAGGSDGARPRNGYVVPVLHLRLPERAVEAGFWGALAASVALGAVDLPIAALVGGAVLVARHQHRR